MFNCLIIIKFSHESDISTRGIFKTNIPKYSPKVLFSKDENIQKAKKKNLNYKREKKLHVFKIVLFVFNGKQVKVQMCLDVAC